MRIERLDFEEWATALPEAGFEVFHTAEALSVLNHHTTGNLILFGGYRARLRIPHYPSPNIA
jgi:hypothetical protein